MMLRKRLIPVAALVVAIGASAAGAATAAETLGGGKVGVEKVGVEKIGADKATQASHKKIAQAGHKKTDVVSLDQVAAKLGVSKAALVQAIDETKQWIIASKTKPSVARFEQHLADQLHVPVAELTAVFQ